MAADVGTDADTIRRFFAAAGVAQYTDKLIDEGFDSLSTLLTIDETGLQDLKAAAGMKPGHLAALLHLLWRWRRQLLDPKRTLQMGKYHACRAHLTSVPGLNRQDLDFKEKQHWPGVLRIFSKATIDYLTQKVMQDKHDEKRATLAYVWAGYKLRKRWARWRAWWRRRWTRRRAWQRARRRRGNR